GLRASIYCAALSLAEYSRAVCDGGQRSSDFPRFPQFRREDSTKRLAALAEGVCHWRLAGRQTAMASHVYVDLHGDRSFVYRLPAFQRELSPDLVHAA